MSSFPPYIRDYRGKFNYFYYVVQENLLKRTIRQFQYQNVRLLAPSLTYNLANASMLLNVQK